MAAMTDALSRRQLLARAAIVPIWVLVEDGSSGAAVIAPAARRSFDAYG
jgi:hypothetical protein